MEPSRPDHARAGRRHLARRWLVELPARTLGRAVLAGTLLVLLVLAIGLVTLAGPDGSAAGLVAIVGMATVALVVSPRLMDAARSPVLPFDPEVTLHVLERFVDDEEARRQLVVSLRRQGSRLVLPHLLSWIEHPSLQVRRVAVATLRTLRWKPTLDHHRPIRLALQGRLSDLLALRDRHPHAVLAALRILALRLPELSTHLHEAAAAGPVTYGRRVRQVEEELDPLVRLFLLFGYQEAAAVLREVLPQGMVIPQSFQPEPLVDAVWTKVREAVDLIEGGPPRALPAPRIPSLR
jgi:hypothetical protein